MGVAGGETSASPPVPTELAEAELRALLARYGDGEIDDMGARIAIDGIAKRYGVSAPTFRGAFFADARKLKARPGKAAPDADGEEDDKLTPASNPKPLAHILDVVCMMVKRQVWCEPAVAYAVTLWIAGTYGYQMADVYPRLALISEMRRCGKSTLLITLAHLVFAPEMADNISPAAMYRMIAMKLMTLLIDEVDSFMRADSGIRNVLNAGYARNGSVKRVEPTPDGKGFAVVNFPCFCPVAVAGIGGLPETVIDRSIVVRLQRAPKADAARQRRLRLRELVRYQHAIVPHLLAHTDAIRVALEAGTENMPEGLHDRALDNWEPLFAVAELAGGEWSARAAAAALALSSTTTDEPHGLVEMLLVDIRTIVEAPRLHAIRQWQEWVRGGRSGPRPPRLLSAQRPLAIRTGELLAGLIGMAHRPWPESGKGRPITERWLADRLRGLGVLPDRGRVAEWQFDANGEPGRLAPVSLTAALRQVQPRLRVYRIDDLRAAWRRCL